jgi:hypothetical protein
MQRITDRDIAAALARLNTATGSPTAAWHIVSTDADGRTRMESNVGHWHLNSAYGGVQLARMHNEHGGIESFGGYGTKREAFTRIHAMLDALRLAADDAATRVAQATERRDALRWALDQIADDLDPDHQAAFTRAKELTQ